MWLLFGLANFVQYAAKFGVQLSTIACVNYGKVLSSESCWGSILISAYTFAVWLLYAFTLVSPYLHHCGLNGSRLDRQYTAYFSVH